MKDVNIVLLKRGQFQDISQAITDICPLVSSIFYWGSVMGLFFFFIIYLFYLFIYFYFFYNFFPFYTVNFFGGFSPQSVPSQGGCTQHSDCLFSEACIGGLCSDPCRCGVNAECFVSQHRPYCTCPPSYAGDPSVACYRGRL